MMPFQQLPSSLKGSSLTQSSLGQHEFLDASGTDLSHCVEEKIEVESHAVAQAGQYLVASPPSVSMANHDNVTSPLLMPGSLHVLPWQWELWLCRWRLSARRNMRVLLLLFDLTCFSPPPPQPRYLC
jgi:hypothetical protein